MALSAMAVECEPFVCLFSKSYLSLRGVVQWYAEKNIHSLPSGAVEVRLHVAGPVAMPIPCDM